MEHERMPIADRADVAIGTRYRYLYAATKAELLIMVQNEKFAAAIDEGLVAATMSGAAEQGALEGAVALVRPVVECVREHVENGRTYLHELVSTLWRQPPRRSLVGPRWHLRTGRSPTER